MLTIKILFIINSPKKKLLCQHTIYNNFNNLFFRLKNT